MVLYYPPIHLFQFLLYYLPKHSFQLLFVFSAKKKISAFIETSSKTSISVLLYFLFKLLLYIVQINNNYKICRCTLRVILNPKQYQRVFNLDKKRSMLFPSFFLLGHYQFKAYFKLMSSWLYRGVTWKIKKYSDIFRFNI